METTKIHVTNMNLHYGDFHALKNINIDIPENQICAMIGPSGCGKSTFLKSINRMNDLVEGCKIDGQMQLRGENGFEDIYGDMDVNHLRKRVGMVFQQPNPFPMSIYDNIAYGPRTHGIKNRHKLDAIVEKALKQAAIWEEVKDRLNKSALGLSGGQQQRLCIARALAICSRQPVFRIKLHSSCWENSLNTEIPSSCFLCQSRKRRKTISPDVSADNSDTPDIKQQRK